MSRKPDADKVPWKYVKMLLRSPWLEDRHYHCPLCDEEIYGDKQDVAEHIRTEHTTEDVISYMEEWGVEDE